MGDCELLDLHDDRRRAGVPVLSVLSGPPAVGLRGYRRWAVQRGYALCPVLIQPDCDVRAEWTAALGAHPMLRQRAISTIADALEMLPEAVHRHADSHSRDAVLLFDRAVASGAPVAFACALLGRAGSEYAVCPELAEVELLVELLSGTEQRPALLAMVHEYGSHIPLQIRRLVELVERAPSLVGAIAVAQEDFAQVMKGPDARWKGLLREGVIRVVPPMPKLQNRAVGGEAAGRGELQAVHPNLQATRQALIAEGADETLLSLFDTAARLAPNDVTGQARSHYEKLLFEVLQEHPETAGLFELNGRLQFHFGVRCAEVDFLSRRLGLAIELDGFYHFTGEEAWRRDRRKDLLLQQHGYQVMRCLADDVVQRLSGLISEIRSAVRRRRQTLQGKRT